MNVDESEARAEVAQARHVAEQVFQLTAVETERLHTVLEGELLELEDGGGGCARRAASRVRTAGPFAGSQT